MALTLEKWQNLYKIHQKLMNNREVTVKDLVSILKLTRRSVYYYLDDLELEFEAEVKRENGKFSYIKPANEKIYTPLNENANEVILSGEDLQKLKDCLDLLKNFKDLPHITYVKLLIHKIEEGLGIESIDEQNILCTEYNQSYIGYKYFDLIYNAIKQKHQLFITYRPFKKKIYDDVEKARIYGYNSSSGEYYWKISPWFLKEYNNRWQLIGYCEAFKNLKQHNGADSDGIVNLSLDRIQRVEILEIESRKCPERLKDEFDYVIGFTRGIKEVVKLWFDKINLQYVKSKPLHWTQQLIEENELGGIISIEVVINYELKQEVKQYLPNVKVISPKNLEIP